MTTLPPPSNAPAKNQKTCLWIGVASGCMLFLLACCCVGILLTGNMAGGGSYTSYEEDDTVLQTSEKATKAPVYLEEQEIYIEEVTGEELKNFGTEMSEVEKGIDSLVVWADTEGYFSRQTADEVEAVRATLPSGEEIRAFYIGTQSKPNDGLVFLQVASQRENGEMGGRSLAARMEGSETEPVLVLFDQEGEVRITGEKFEFSSEISHLETIQIASYSATNLNPLVNNARACTTTAWDEYAACFVSSNNNSVYSFAISCPTALAAVYAAWIGTKADSSGNVARMVRGSTIVAAINACGTAALTCLDDSMDDEPTYRVVSELKQVDTVWKSCINDDPPGILVQNRFQTTLEWSDDRLPFLENRIRVYEFPPNHSEEVMVEDCGGNSVSFVVNTGLPKYVDSSLCEQGKTCREDGQGNATCEPISGNPLPPPAKPGQTITSRGVFKFQDGTPTYLNEKNYIEMKFNSNGGPVTGSGVWFISENSPYLECGKNEIFFNFTFDGSYSAENRTMNGSWAAVGDYRGFTGASCSTETSQKTFSGTFKAKQGNTDNQFVGTFYQIEGNVNLLELLKGFELNSQ